MTQSFSARELPVLFWSTGPRGTRNNLLKVAQECQPGSGLATIEWPQIELSSTTNTPLPVA